jgi:hypothetical protein
MTHEEMPRTEYVVTLNEKDLQELGLFCVIWTQIDNLMSDCLSAVLQTKPTNILTLMDGATIGPRISNLKRLRSEVESNGLSERDKGCLR